MSQKQPEKCEDTGQVYYLRKGAVGHYQCKNCDRFWSSTDEKPICSFQPEKTRCQCEECKIRPHWSDCAVHNEPAEPKGKCTCSHPLASEWEERYEIQSKEKHFGIRSFIRNELARVRNQTREECIGIIKKSDYSNEIQEDIVESIIRQIKN